jgi:hypothetical protein
MTDTTRDLIQRMARELDLYRQLLRDDCTSTHPFADEARAYLAQPEPEGPTDEELHNLWLELYGFHDGPTSGDVAGIARAVLARWGSTLSTPQP